MEAVGPLVVSRGEHVTSRELAQAAGVSEGTIFKVFGCKDDLVAAVVADALDHDRLDRALSEAIDAGRDWFESLTGVIGVLQARTESVFGLFSAIDSRFHPEPSGPLPVTDVLVRFVAAAPVRLRGDAVDAAHTLRAITFALSHPLLIDVPRPPAAVADLFLHGYRAA